MVFVIHWHELAMDLHVFPIPIPAPASLSTRSLWVFPVHQPWALVSCIQPGLVICFAFDSILVSMLFSQNIPLSPSPTESKICSIYLHLFFCPEYRVIITIFLNSIYMRLYTVLVFSRMVATFYIPTNNAKAFHFSACPHPHQHLFFIRFCLDRSHPNSCEVICQCAFDLHFPGD